MNSPLGVTLHVDGPFDLALNRTREALQAEGFGILTEIDVQATFKEKLGRDFRPYVILGACNAPLAHRALTADPQVGLLLPCNVTVEGTSTGKVLVRLVDPQTLLAESTLQTSPALSEVAGDAHERLGRVARALGG